jgi:hypothetical protein
VSPSERSNEAPAASTAPPARVPSWRKDGTWGWFVVASSVFAGSALTAMGLAIDCEGKSPSCERGSSIAIWGGVGVAAIGSILGLTVVANARDAAPPAPPPTLRRAPARICRAAGQ